MSKFKLFDPAIENKSSGTPEDIDGAVECLERVGAVEWLSGAVTLQSFSSRGEPITDAATFRDGKVGPLYLESITWKSEVDFVEAERILHTGKVGVFVFILSQREMLPILSITSDGGFISLALVLRVVQDCGDYCQSYDERVLLYGSYLSSGITIYNSYPEFYGLDRFGADPRKTGAMYYDILLGRNSNGNRKVAGRDVGTESNGNHYNSAQEVAMNPVLAPLLHSSPIIYN